MWTVHDRDSTMSVVCTAHLTQGQGLCLDKGDHKAQSVTGRLGASHPISHLVRMLPWGPCQGAAHQPRRKENEGCWRGDTGHRELGLPGNTHRRQGSHLRSLPWQQVWGPEVHAGRGLQTPPVTRPKAKQKPAHLTIVAPQVEVDSLWSVSVSAAVAGGEGHPNYAAPVARGQPALLVVAPAAHGLLLLTLGDAALPGQAEDVGVAAQDRPMLHRCIHTFFGRTVLLKEQGWMPKNLNNCSHWLVLILWLACTVLPDPFNWNWPRSN